MLSDFLSLVFPKVCFACGKGLFKNEDCICTHCFYHLPKTNFHLYPDNPVIKLFWGRVNVFSASSLYSFQKGGKVQQLLHQLKYRGKKEVGISLGRYYGKELKMSPFFSSIDAVLPVPLHPDKLKRRGYNQSEQFAIGLSETMKIPAWNHAMTRLYASETQTRKSRFARWKNVEEIFKVIRSDEMQGKHLLLVDDVVTTGSTLEACAEKILEVPGTKVSIATIATAMQ